jgi:drug/metabolite transporter (DMT)-like permease
MPSLSDPPLSGSVSMLVAGIAWGIYSLRGKGVGDPTKLTAGNLMRAVPITAVLSVLMLSNTSLDTTGFWYAVSSSTLASGLSVFSL